MVTSKVLLVYGSGGHNEEMIRLYKQMNELLNHGSCKIEFLSFCDDDVKHVVTTHATMVPTVTDKFSYVRLFLKMPYVLMRSFMALYGLTRNHKIDFMITTGPGIGVACALFLKFKKVKIISIENCSRFYSKSLTGRAMHFLSDYFLVQNEELLQIYKKAIYKGRL